MGNAAFHSPPCQLEAKSLNQLPECPYTTVMHGICTILQLSLTSVDLRKKDHVHNKGSGKFPTGIQNIFTFCTALVQQRCTGRRKLNSRDDIFKLLRGPGIDSASLCSLAGRYKNLIPPRCLAPAPILFKNSSSGGPVRKPYSYSVSSPHKFFYNTSSGTYPDPKSL